MRHPFDGIMQPEAPPATRRSWLKIMLGGLAGLLGLNAASSYAAAPPRKVRLQPEPNPEPPADPPTKALREQGRVLTKARGEGAVTQAVNEQGGPTTRRVGEEGAMTKALNENG